MLVSLFADASLCPHSHAGGWGAWAKSERGMTKGGGMLKGWIHSSSEAEIKAIVNCLFIALRDGVVRDGDDVLVQSDNTNALAWIDGKKPKKTPPYWTETVSSFRKLVKAHGLKVRTRHVKGHCNKDEPRFAVNRLCDQLARVGMEQARLTPPEKPAVAQPALIPIPAPKKKRRPARKKRKVA
jgi:ribonuclease HI